MNPCVAASGAGWTVACEPLCAAHCQGRCTSVGPVVLGVQCAIQRGMMPALLPAGHGAQHTHTLTHISAWATGWWLVAGGWRRVPVPGVLPKWCTSCCCVRALAMALAVAVGAALSCSYCLRCVATWWRHRLCRGSALWLFPGCLCCAPLPTCGVHRRCHRRAHACAAHRAHNSTNSSAQQLASCSCGAVRGVNSDSATGGKPMGSRTHMWHAGLDCSALLLSTAGGHTHTHIMLHYGKWLLAAAVARTMSTT